MLNLFTKYRPVLQKIILIIAIVPLMKIFFTPENYKEMGELSWKLLLILLAIRPLGDIFPDFKILKKLLPLRKEVGILCGTLAIAHSIGFFFQAGISLPAGFLLSEIWDYKNTYFWGMIGFIIAIVLTLTSNIFSIKLLKTYWKKLHKLTYVFLLTVALHIIFIKAGKIGTFYSFEVWEPAVPVLILCVLWGLSAYKIKFRYNEKKSS